MAHLELTGVSEDGKRLLLTDDSGAEHELDIDQRLRSALREHQPRRQEKQMESTLRPRDIQARIRSGESAEDVAAAAGTTVDRIMAFAGPVLAERQHVADRAQRSSVRRRAGEAAGTARTLGEAVEAHLRSLHVDPERVEWDSWRRDDGRWNLVAAYETSKRSGIAELTFDLPGNFVLLDNDDARWLVGEALPEPAPTRDDLQHARQRRLTTVDPVDQELPLGDDAIQLVHDEPVDAFLDTEPPAEPTVAAREHELVEQAADAAALDDAPTTEQPAVRDEPPAAAAAAEPAEPAADEPASQEQPPPRRPVRKSRGRASVPSWDEIMFGGGKQD
ncbi:septation protein SepH [Nocardioides sp. SOB77]|uniref:Septation protein SepH n=1 Tax=Nocardioides oceani TaxID=3058369 RepID=A0ABT8FES8_9ACTN|nr:septation protein SepH [Nocardioides oceani]MDN4173166.1 septation protein SepH [Nocardioides oceani]